MSKVVCDISISADGYSAGLNQTEERPFGGADESILHAWMFDTAEENQAELDAILGAKAFIMGRNMFGPIRGEWTGDWKGWWGPEPPSTPPSSCSPTTSAIPWSWAVAQRSTSSPTASKPRWSKR